MPRFILISLGILAGFTFTSIEGQPPKPAAPVPHGRGHKPMSAQARARIHAAAFARHGHRVKSLPKTTAVSFDCRAVFGNVLPVDDQGQCGDCFGVSSADGCSMALIKAGVLPNDGSKGRLSSQYGLDNPSAFEGGCDGGDEAQVIDFAMKNGFPLTSDYGPYTGSPNRNPPNTSGMKFYKIANYGFCTPSQQSGVADTQDIKNCMAQYGVISVAFDAGECDSYQWPGTMVGRGRSVDHAVLLIGWDDNHDNGDGSKGAWLAMNQWGASWGGPNGTFWIKYGADSMGTEAIWITAATLPPPPTPPTPVPPAPPVPPTPPTPPAPTPGVTVNLTIDGPLAAGSYQIVPQGSTVISPTMTLADLAKLIDAMRPPSKNEPPLIQSAADAEWKAGATSAIKTLIDEVRKLKDANEELQRRLSPAPQLPSKKSGAAYRLWAPDDYRTLTQLDAKGLHGYFLGDASKP